jgi:predicted TIM-barrel fold metal-dependent hydrolase
MTASHDDQAPPTARSNPANRLGLDYRSVPPRKLPGGTIIDIHTHLRAGPGAARFFEAATAYGVDRVYSMSALDQVDDLRAAFPGRVDFIAIPRWREFGTTTKFRQQWLDDLAAFREKGARIMKFWMAPPMRGEHGLTLRHDFVQPVIQAALDLGYNFMVHIGDPSRWWRAGGKYADTARFGSKRDQYDQLEYFLDKVSPRFVIGAHLGGDIEEPDFLQDLLDRHPNYYLDSSATKWVVREIARQPARVHEFVLRNPQRILFGTDIVVEGQHGFDHYASRFWAHQMLWETTYAGESPIEDPDADRPPRLAGLDLPAEVLTGLYWENARRLGLCTAPAV